MNLTATNATSYTDLQVFGRCPRKYYYRTKVRIQPKRKAAYFRMGSTVHKMFELIELGEGLPRIVAEMEGEVHADTTLFAEEIEGRLEIIRDAARIVEGYYEYYENDWEILHVEETFLIMLDSGAVISFTPDLVVRDRNGFVWIVDRKTTNSTPTDGLPFADLQALLYYAGVKALYPDLRGFIFDRLRKKVPTQPRLTKTGEKRVADLNRIDTTYEILRNFLETEAPDLLDNLDHRRRLAELADHNRFYFRETVIVTDEQVQNMLLDVDAQLLLVRTAERSDAYPRVLQSVGMSSCDKCEFVQICQAELLGWDTERVLDEFYEPRDDSYKEYEVQDDE